VHPILADRRRLLLHLIAWSLVGVMLALLVHAITGANAVPALVFAVPLGLAGASTSLSAWYVCRALPASRTPAIRIAVTATFASLVTAAVWSALGQVWWLALSQINLPLPGPPGAAVTLLLVGLGGLAYLLVLAVQYSIQASEESADAARQALVAQVAHRDAELRALRSQVDPHFLFNSLNSIVGLINADPAKAREMCQRLADFLRDSLSLGATDRISLGREVALAEQYLKVEQVRFGRRLQVATVVSPDGAGVMVPPLILQPLVENAVRHGVATQLEGGRIEIAARRAGSQAVVVVTNPRDPDLSRRGTGFGLDIVRRRLYASFGDRAALNIAPGPESFEVTMIVPVEEASA